MGVALHYARTSGPDSEADMVVVVINGMMGYGSGVMVMTVAAEIGNSFSSLLV